MNSEGLKGSGAPRTTSKAAKTLRRALGSWQLYTLLLPALIYYIIFCYGPMYGVQIAFRDYSAAKGIWASEWVGLKHLMRFFNSYYFTDLIRNTLTISLFNLALGFPMPILLALCVNELRNGMFKKVVQTASYAPHFISTVVMCAIIINFTNASTSNTGIINRVIMAFGGEPVAFMTTPGWFPAVYVISGVWQGMGWGSIIYLAALSGVDEQLHEAAVIDGATRMQRIIHINIPHIIPTMVIMLILNSGAIMSLGADKAYLLQNDLNTDRSEVISTYVYKSGLLNAQYSFSAAVGLFNSVINMIMLWTVNFISGKISENSLW